MEYLITLVQWFHPLGFQNDISVQCVGILFPKVAISVSVVFQYVMKLLIYGIIRLSDFPSLDPCWLTSGNVNITACFRRGLGF